MDGYVIRAATPLDAGAIAEVHVASWRATYPGIVPQAYIDSLKVEEFAGRWLERLSAASSDHCIHVAEEAGRVCGFAAGGPSRGTVDGYAGEMYAIYLFPSLQRKGVGSALFRSVAAAIARSGRESLFVWVLQENQACGFYERLGGSLVKQTTIDIGGASLVEVAYGWLDVRLLIE